MDVQVCPAKIATGITNKSSKTATKSTTKEDTESEDDFQTPRRKKTAPALRSKKRGRPSPLEEANGKRRPAPNPADLYKCSDEDEKDDYFLNPAVNAPPSSKGAKRLSIDEERAAELRHLPTANLAAMICTQTVKK